MSVDFTPYLIDDASSEKVTIDKFNRFIDAAQNAMNNIENDMIVAATITAAKVEGGAVPDSDVATDGSANKIVKTGSSGEITMTDDGSIKVVIS